MDFGGFFLFILLAGALFVGGIYLAVRFVKRMPVRRYDIGLWLGGLAILAIFGRFLYQTYGLDESLYVAADEGNTAQVKTLLSAGASPNAKWEDGTSALAAAEAHGHKEIVVLLEKAGADE